MALKNFFDEIHKQTFSFRFLHLVLKNQKKYNSPTLFLKSQSDADYSYIALGQTDEIIIQNEEKDAFEQLQRFLDKEKNWAFGYLSYDLKNSVEKLVSENEDHLNFPALYFFRPAYLVRFNKTEMDVLIDHPDYDYKQLLDQDYSFVSDKKNKTDSTWNQKISKETYLNKIKTVKNHIKLGYIYELNYCFQFFQENKTINPWAVFLELDKNTSAPFACYFHRDNNYLMSASPERFLKKTGTKVWSQPIKGTIKRGVTEKEDNELKKQLLSDPKERSENIMITDLVRNDLSKIAKKGSVKVDELCEIYSFKTVHQMITTISAEVSGNIPVTKIVKNAFPMGSMTGAPKIRAMELIEELEETKRGIYSGAVGFFSPEMDFDFNVVIRSIAYNSDTKFVSAMVGGAITDASDEAREYEECLLKAKSLLNSVN